VVAHTAPERVSLGVASLRAYGLHEDLLDAMRKVRASGLTFAPEAGTQRMRDVINKNVTEAQLLETAERVFSRGFDKMKLYFICGLPTETDEDVAGIIEVGKNALAVGKRVGRRPRVTVSVSVHVPKPHTPFQWCAMDSVEQVERKQRLLRDAARAVRGLELRVHPPKTSVLEAIIARGDRRLADVIERAFAGGARFDSWEDRLRTDVWQEAFEHFGIETSRYLGTLPVSGRLPWDHLDIGLEDGFLAREYRKSLASRLSPPCGKPAGTFLHPTNVHDAEGETRKLVCYDCGVACDLSQMREQRIGFLRQMGSFVPAHELSQPRPIPDPGPYPAPHPSPDPDPAPTPGPQPAPPPSPVPTARRARRPEDYRPVRAGAPPERFRLRFAKRGPAALLGHLDLGRELPRVLRRAGLRAAYSEGFHPKPDLSFGPALALGIASLDEYFDVKLIDGGAATELVTSLNRASCDGLEFLAAAKLGPQDPGLSRIVTGARYVIALSEAALDGQGGKSVLTDHVQSFLHAETAWVLRRIEGVGKKVDVRRHVAALAVGGDPELMLLEQAGFVGRLVPLRATLHIGQSGSARINELVQVLLGNDEFPYVAARTQLIAGAGSPLELSLHRRAPSSAHVQLG
jgi:radical SAM-linked protein